MKKSVFILCVVFIFTLFFAACSGGGSEKKEDGSNTGGDDSGGTTPPISDSQRTVILDEASTQFNSLLNLPTDQANQEMAAYLNTLPNIEAAGVSNDGCAWGRFSDGRLAIFINNRKPPEEPIILGAMAQESAPQVIPLYQRASDPPSDLPSQKMVKFGNALGTDWCDTESIFTDWFQQKEYKVPGGFGLYPSDLINPTPGLALLYIDAHGGSGQWPDGSSAFAIWTKEARSDFGDKQYADELDNHRLAYMYAASHLGADGKWVEEWHYAFTAAMVMKYLTFSLDSMVFINACSSDEPVMRSAFFAKGASVYAGWSSPVDNGPSVKAAEKLFDRMLGINVASPVESPKQRAFDWKSVYSWIQENGYDIGTDAGGCYLMMTANPADESGMGLFAPSIQFIWYNEYDRELWVYGLFGENPGGEGKVTVDGVPASILEWARDDERDLDLIKCTIPDEGAGSYGTVKVTVREHESNERKLSRLAGDVKLTHDVGDGRKFVITHHLRFRADLQSFRTEPGGTPEYINPKLRLYADLTSTADYEFSGSASGLTWSGSGTLDNNVGETQYEKNFIASALLDPESKSLHLTLQGTIKDGLIMSAGGQSVIMTMSYGWDKFNGVDSDYPYPYIEISLGSDFGISEGDASASEVFLKLSPQQNDSVTVEWDDLPCQSPPGEEAI